MKPRTPALIETIRVRDGAAPLWYLHLRRLVASCKALGIPFPPRLGVPAGGVDRAHRLEVGRGGVEVTERELPSAEPVRLWTSSVVHTPYPHKTTDRDVFHRALLAARGAGADDALLSTAGGHVAEATIWCLFWWEGDQLCAPARDLGILVGVSRLRIEELLGPVAERRVTAAALRGRSLFLSNALRGVVEVAALDDVAVPGQALTKALQARFWP
jgi:branched-subunit amino acid aminotransferase/4-amino-4-deoxychorismate lyase